MPSTQAVLKGILFSLSVGMVVHGVFASICWNAEGHPGSLLIAQLFGNAFLAVWAISAALVVANNRTGFVRVYNAGLLLLLYTTGYSIVVLYYLCRCISDVDGTPVYWQQEAEYLFTITLVIGGISLAFLLIAVLVLLVYATRFAGATRRGILLS